VTFESTHASLRKFVLSVVGLAAVGASAQASAIEEVIVIGTPVEVGHTYYTALLWEQAFWLALQDLLGTMEEAPADDDDVQQQEDFLKDQEPVSCSSSLQVRAKYAASRAGWGTQGHVYVLYYPGGGHQYWRIVSNTIMAVVVVENGACIP
jgi:hypothetical protein